MTDLELEILRRKAKTFNEAFVDLMQCVNRLFHVYGIEKNKFTETREMVEKITTSYSGNCCPSCGMFMVVRTGTCLTCQSCGWNGGCG